jgi:hypothetical protein
VTSPVVTHPVCDLDMKRRVREARMDAIARAVVRTTRRTLLDRLLGRTPAPLQAPCAEDLLHRDTGEDVWSALRF